MFRKPKSKINSASYDEAVKVNISQHNLPAQAVSHSREIL